MSLTSLNLLLLLVSVTFLIAQLFVKQKHTTHLIFAVFCGSVAMVALKKLTGDQIGAYQYLIGMATCATCNAYWLLSRSLFRKHDAIALPHILMAAAIALLVMTKQGYLFIASWFGITADTQFAQHLLGELTGLFSSCIIVLTMWEGFNGYKAACKQEQAQRRFFIATIVSAVGFSTLVNSLFADNPSTQQWLMSLITLAVLTCTQFIVWWRFKPQSKTEVQLPPQTSQEPSRTNEGALTATDETDLVFANTVQALIVSEQQFLQANLKVGDIAKAMDVPEYRVSKAMREHLGAKNFNDYINKLRIDYACTLLKDPAKRQWSVLVIGLESGFASVGPFTRAFKSFTGYTPAQYRQAHQNDNAELSSHDNELESMHASLVQAK